MFSGDRGTTRRVMSKAPREIRRARCASTCQEDRNACLQQCRERNGGRNWSGKTIMTSSNARQNISADRPGKRTKLHPMSIAQCERIAITKQLMSDKPDFTDSAHGIDRCCWKWKGVKSVVAKVFVCDGKWLVWCCLIVWRLFNSVTFV